MSTEWYLNVKPFISLQVTSDEGPNDNEEQFTLSPGKIFPQQV
jgi:hypothetical protein